MFAGENIQHYREPRRANTSPLRAPKNATIMVDGKNVVPDVHGLARQVPCVRQPGPQAVMEGL